MKKISITILTLLAILSSCEEENENNIFKGITETNESGFVIGSVDDSDWNFDDSWNDKETDLFSESFENMCFIDESYHILAYPNPSNDVCYISFYLGEDKRVAYRIVDKDYNVIFSTDSASSTMAISLERMNLSNETIRIYYKVFSENCELKGHGDIKKK
jgi:hypothetical protein